jgi:hypothetical protein
VLTSADSSTSKIRAKKKRRCVNVILGAVDYRRFESYCEKVGYKKSTLIARLIRDHLQAEKFMLQNELPLDQ